MRIEEALDQFLRQLEANGRSMPTRDQVRRHVRLLAQWSIQEGHSAHVEDLGHEGLARFLASPAARARRGGGTKKATTVNALRTSMRCFFAYLDQVGIVGRNPARLIRRAQCGTGPPRVLSEVEEERLLAALDAGEGNAARRDRVLFRLMLATGIRVGSAVVLAVEDVDLERREMRLRNVKGGREDVAFMPAHVVSMLQLFISHLGPGPLFRIQAGAPLSPRHVHRRLRLWAEKAGITRPLWPHALRHTMATRLYERSGDVLLVQRALHHRSIASTMVYARVSDGQLRAALEGGVGEVGWRNGPKARMNTQALEA